VVTGIPFTRTAAFGCSMHTAQPMCKEYMMHYCTVSVQGALETSRDKVKTATEEKDEVKTEMTELRSSAVTSRCIVA
jgi:hypothetical protein